MNDWRGTPIGVGTRIVYPGRSSSYLWLNEAEVTDVGQHELKVRRVAETRGRERQNVESTVVTLTRLDLVTVVTAP